LDFHRNGLIFIADLEGFGLKNLDLSIQRKINSALMDNFPLRVRKVLLVNPPLIINTIIAGIRLFMKKKIMDRIQVIQREEVLEHIEADQLLTNFGGNIDYSAAQFINYMNDVHENHSPIEFKTIKKKKTKKTPQSSRESISKKDKGNRKVSKSKMIQSES